MPWPEPGFSGSYAARYADAPQTEPIDWTIDETAVRRGDGFIVSVLELNVSNGAWKNYYSMATGDVIARWDPGHGYQVNAGSWAVNLWGHCVREGDRLVRPYGDGAHSLTVDVLSIEPELLVQITTPPIAAPRQPAGETSVVRMVWHEETPFPDETYAYKADEEPRVVAVMVRQDGPTAARAAREQEDVPLAIHSTTDGTPCWERPMHHPDLTALPAVITFDRYIDNMSRDASLARYLSGHEEACAIWSTYEVVKENSSTAYVWTTIFADRSNVNYWKRWTVRCYHEDYLRLLNGDCAERPHYSQLDELGQVQGIAVDTSKVEAALRLEKTMENVERFASSLDFTRFTWRAMDMENTPRTSRALRPVPAPEFAPALEFDYGGLTANVSYLGSRGEEVRDTSWQSDYMYFFPNGWAYYASVHHVRPVD